MPRWLAAALAIPMAAQLLCTPIVAVLSESVSLVAIVANLLAGPAVAPATVLGLVATMIAPISVDLASVPARLAGFAARWIVEVATNPPTCRAPPSAGRPHRQASPCSSSPASRPPR